MKVGKPKSKRTPVRLRHKIEKASANKQRKARRDAKKNPEWRSRLKKDPGIPNLFPFKNKVLEELEEQKRQKEAERERKREIAKAQRLGTSVDEIDGATGAADEDDDEELLDLEDDFDDDMDEGDSSNPMAALLASARARAAEYEQEDNDNDAMEEDDEEWGGVDDEDKAQSTASRKDSSRKAFDKAFKSVIDSSDIILYVLDARDPDGTRSREVEQSIMSAGSSKRLIFILNKIDLIPANVLQDWTNYLSRSFETLPLRASTASSNAKTFDHKSLNVKTTSETLFKKLKTYAHEAQMKRAITVGVIGYPNVGKSSVINALTSRLGKNANACPTGAEAGVTTALREVKIDNKLKLIDSPGIVFPSQVSAATGDAKAAKDDDKARLILLNAVPPKEIADPVPAVSLLLRRLGATENGMQRLLDVYSIPPLMTRNGDATTDFLVQVARKRGRLGKGGVPNLYAAAMTVVSDWWAGRVQGWLEAPTVINSEATAAQAGSGATADQKEIVTTWGKEFKIDGFGGSDEKAEGEAMAVEA